MISPKFYSQITICPACSGWGTKDMPPIKYTNICSDCLGQGVSVVQSENIYIFDAPTFIDYKSRNRALILKLVTVFLVIVLLTFIFIFIRILVSQALTI